MGDDGFAVHSKVYLCIYKLAKAVRLSKGKPCQTDEKIEDIFHQFGKLLLSSQLEASPQIRLLNQPYLKALLFTKKDTNWKVNTKITMEETEEKRIIILPTIRLKPSEKAAIDAEFNASFYSNKSEFLRYKLLDKTYSEYRQQRFEATIKAGELLDALGKIGNNVNQIAKVLNTYKDGKMRREELLVMISAIKLIGKVKDILEETPEE